MKSLSTLIRFATESIEARSAAQQVEIYEAIAELLPDKAEALAAERLAFAIRETAKLQLNFQTFLKSEK